MRDGAKRGPAQAWSPRWLWFAGGFLAVTTLLRLAQLPTLELAPDEAYYWDWSRRLALGYYDQGPMIAYVIRLTTLLFGTNEFGVRFGVLAASLGTLLCAGWLAARRFSPLAGFLAVFFLGLTPLMELGSRIATYDPLLVFFWALTVVFLDRALFPSPLSVLPGQPVEYRTSNIENTSPLPPGPYALSNWLAAGAAAGAGLLSKHTMALILPCLLLFLTLSPPHRRWLTRPEPYAALGLALLMYAGVFWWNAQHHWWTFGHLLFLTAKSNGTPWQRLGEFVGSQALLLGPGLFLGALYSGWRLAIRDQPIQNQKSQVENFYPLFLLCLGLPVFLFFCMLSLKAKVQANWAPCAWLTMSVLFAGGLADFAGRSREAARRAFRGAALVGTLSALVTLAMISPGLRYRIGLRLPPDADLSNQTYGWREVAARAQQTRQAMEREGRTVFLCSNSYQYCALMAFYLPDHPETHHLFLRFRLAMYAAYMERLQRHLGEDAIFINENRGDDVYLRQLFERVEWEEPYPVWRRPYYTEPIRRVQIARCYGFRRYIGLQWAKGG